MLIIFDVEGVLLNAEYLPVLARNLVQKRKEIWDITKQGIRRIYGVKDYISESMP
jgi:phosphoserine phosphatase